MRRAGLILGLMLVGLAAHAFAQTSSLYTPATKDDVAAVQAQIPQPAMVVPPTEMPGGAIGTPGSYRPADARQPRITRSKTVTLAADGTATFDWSVQGAIATPVQVALSPVYAGTGVPKCWVTTTSATSATVKCVIETVSLLSVAGVNVGSVTNNAPSGLQVGVIALPPS